MLPTAIQKIDLWLFHLINQLPHPQWVDRLSLTLDLAGEARDFIALSLGMLFVGLILKRRKLVVGGFFLAVSILTTGYVVEILKQFFERARPYEALKDVYFLAETSGTSFPSGHTGLYTSLGAFMIFYFNRAKGWWLLLIFLGGLARIYQGVHYPSDVVFSWTIGIFIAYITAKTARFTDELRQAKSLYKYRKI